LVCWAPFPNQKESAASAYSPFQESHQIWWANKKDALFILVVLIE
jgi:hypothetical protein